MDPVLVQVIESLQVWTSLYWIWIAICWYIKLVSAVMVTEKIMLVTAKSKFSSHRYRILVINDSESAAVNTTPIHFKIHNPALKFGWV